MGFFLRSFLIDKFPRNTQVVLIPMTPFNLDLLKEFWHTSEYSAGEGQSKGS